MSERGVFAVDRGIWDHDVLSENQPFSRREAWLWLLSEAAWKPHRRRIIGRSIELDRGQYAGSLRFIASKWQWSEPRVRRFLSALISSEMVDAKTDAGVTVITICKYDEYQRVSLPGDAMRNSDVDAGATQERRKVEDKEDKEVIAEAAERARPLVSPEAQNLADELLVIAGHDLTFVPPGWCGAPMRVQAWLSSGWSREIIVAAVRSAAHRKRGPPANSVQFFENAVAEEVARQAAPLPVVQVRQAETLTVNHGTSQARPGGSLTASLRRDLAALEQSDGADFALPASGILRLSN